MNMLSSFGHTDKPSGGRHAGAFSLHAVLTVCSALLCAVFVLLSGLSGAPQKNWSSWGRHEKQYEELTAALLSGRLSLPEVPAAFLAEMDNPYDPAARSIAAAEHDAYTLIDTAYYDGKYYVYFGVTPALLIFLPTKLLLHRIPPTWIAVIAVAVLCVPAAFLFVNALCRRLFPKTSAPMRMLSSIALVDVLGLPYLAAFCTTYSMPVIMGLFLMLLGLSCFLSAERPDGSMRLPLLLLGAVLLALTIGCRPAFGASFLLLFPIFADAIRQGSFFRKEKTALTNTVAVLFPAFLLSAALLLYNALRFDNPLEFGFRYLLTTRDLSRGAHSIGESLAGARLLFFQLPVVHRVFPFMEIVGYSGRYQDSLYVEPLFGGLLPLHPFLPMGLLIGAVFLFFSAPRRKRRTASFLSLSSLVIGILLLLTDASIAGISQRYESDFALFFFLPAAIAFFRTEEFQTTSPAGKMPTKAPYAAHIKTLLPLLLLSLCVCIGVFLSFASILCDGRYFAMRDWNPEVYNKIAAFFH